MQFYYEGFDFLIGFSNVERRHLVVSASGIVLKESFCPIQWLPILKTFCLSSITRRARSCARNASARTSSSTVCLYSHHFEKEFGHTPLSLKEDIPWRCRQQVVGT